VLFDNDQYKVMVSRNENDVTLVDWTKNAAVRLEEGVENTFSIVLKGSTFVFFANGQQLTTVDDTTIKGIGQVGLGAALFEAKQTATFEFDNLVITSAP
jgi:hypothetical protein